MHSRGGLKFVNCPSKYIRGRETALTDVSRWTGGNNEKEEVIHETYLKQVFAKTGTARQAELVKLMLKSAVRTAGGKGFEVIM